MTEIPIHLLMIRSTGVAHFACNRLSVEGLSLLHTIFITEKVRAYLFEGDTRLKSALAIRHVHFQDLGIFQGILEELGSALAC